MASNDKYSTNTAAVAPGTERRRDDSRPNSSTQQDEVQGEGDYHAAREFNELENAFVESGGVDKAARAAEPNSEAERQDMLEAEQKGKRRSKGEDPGIARPDGESRASPKP